MSADAEQPAPDAGTGQQDELANMWAALPSDATFDSWEKLVQYALKSDDIAKIREVMDAFLAKFPLCYGYWQKYANAETKHGEHARDVLERGVHATPYSIELWLHYITWLRKLPDPKAEEIKEVFKRAAQCVAMDWQSHKLYDKWIEFASSQQDLKQLAELYVTTIGLPTKEAPRYRQAFTEFVANHSLLDILSEQDLQAATLEAKQAKQQQSKEKPAAEAAHVVEPEAAQNGDTEAPPGVDEDDQPQQTGDAVNGENLAGMTVTDEEVKAAWIEKQNARSAAALEERSRREAYESGIRRFWWHYKPLDANQLYTWWTYLDYLQTQGDSMALYSCFERCLVACASYPEFWCRYIKFLQSGGLTDVIDSAIRRACDVFCPRRPSMLLFASLYREASGDVASARALMLRAATDVAPRSLEVLVRRANFERRSGDPRAALDSLGAALSEAMGHGEEESCVHLSLQYANLAATCCVNASGHVAEGGPTEGEPGGQGGADAPQDATPGAADAPQETASGAADAAAAGAHGGEGGDAVKQEGDAAGGNAGLGGGVAAEQAGASEPSEAAAEAALQRCLAKFPGNAALWRGAAAAAEKLYSGAQRCRKVLDVYRQALSATLPVPAASNGAEETGEQQQSAAAQHAQPALPLHEREALAAAAAATVDECGDVVSLWEAQDLALHLQAEVLYEAAVQSSHKRNASGALAGQPAAKRQAVYGVSGAHDAALHQQYYAQQQQQQQHYSTADYAAYHQGQQQGYYPNYGY